MEKIQAKDHASDKELLYGDITFKIIGCAMKAHSKLGNGFQEVIYQNAKLDSTRGNSIRSVLNMNKKRRKKMECILFTLFQGTQT